MVKERAPLGMQVTADRAQAVQFPPIARQRFDREIRSQVHPAAVRGCRKKCQVEGAGCSFPPSAVRALGSLTRGRH